jgi:hypothetical protein
MCNCSTALGGAVKADPDVAPAILALRAGVRFQSRHLGPGHMDLAHVPGDEAAHRDVRRSFLRSCGLVRNPAEIKAVSFSRK